MVDIEMNLIPQKNRTIVCFGDSITNGYVPFLKKELESSCYAPYDLVNAGVNGETSRDAIKRIDEILSYNPEIVILGFGMNDCARQSGISVKEYEENMSTLVETFQTHGVKTMLLTIHPKIFTAHKRKINGVLTGKYSITSVFSCLRPSGFNEPVKKFNKVIKNISLSRKIKVVNIHYFWALRFKRNSDGLKDDVHPNEKGNLFYAEVIAKHLKRRSYIILWQYNGDPCECNYACPYCPADPRTQNGHYFTKTITEWKNSFKDAFGDQRLVFYLAYGEPMLGENFYDVLKMVGEVPNWSVRITSNLSQPLDELVKTKVAKEGRLDINASFHPAMTKLEAFLSQVLFLRKHGIEPSVVYVMWPPFLKRFEHDFQVFNEHNFLVHVRRFEGFYKGKKYPQSYTESERKFMAQYMDDATIKYMLASEPSFGKLTWSGVDFFIVDNQGDVGFCDALKPELYSLGNILQGTFHPLLEPRPFPGRFRSDTTVDGVANFVELNYDQLDDGNNTMSFSRQGGVYRTSDGVYYKNMKTNFDDPLTRAKYNFPPRNLKDCFYVMKYQNRSRFVRFTEIISFITPKFFKNIYRNIERKMKQSITVLSVYKKLVNLKH